MAPTKRKAAADTDAPTRVTRSKSKGATNPPKAEKVITKAPKGKPPKSEKENKSAAKKAGNSKKSNGEVKAEVNVEKQTSVVIEHCKQCNSFKTRAIQVKEGLEKAVPGVTVTLNPDKPRRGCFEIRVEGGETFISLLDMKRPFQPMKALDMEQVITDIAEKLK